MHILLLHCNYSLCHKKKSQNNSGWDDVSLTAEGLSGTMSHTSLYGRHKFVLSYDQAMLESDSSNTDLP